MPKRILDLHPGTYMLPKQQWRALPDKDQVALPRQIRAEPRSLNDCTACHMQASQVSVRLEDRSGSGILKGTSNLAPKIR